MPSYCDDEMLTTSGLDDMFVVLTKCRKLLEKAEAEAEAEAEAGGRERRDESRQPAR